MKFKERYFHIAVIVFCTSFLSSIVFADSINFSASHQKNANNTISDAFAFKYIKDLNPQADVDVLYQGSNNRSSNGVVALYEVGARYKVPIAKRTQFFVRGMAGSLQPSGISSKNYLGAETGIMTKVTPKVGIRADYTRMTGIGKSKMDNNFSRIWVSYDLTSTQSVGVRRDFMRGDVEFDAWMLLFKQKF